MANADLLGTDVVRAENAWLWPLRIPDRIAQRTQHLAERFGAMIARRGLWIPLCLACGTLPILLSYATGVGGYRPLTALLATPLMTGAIAIRSARLGLAILGVTFISHCGITIALAAHDPDGLRVVLPSGADYWTRTHHWIVSGESPEYRLGWWLPAHCQLLLAVALFTYTSFGFIAIWQGLLEVDLMNFYVGQLLAHSDDAFVALAFGWHPWSVCRGIGYLFVIYAVASYSYHRLTKTAVPVRRHIYCWVAGLTFLVLDGTIKYLGLETVRTILLENLA